MPCDILSADERLTDQLIAHRLGTHKATVCRWRTRGVSLPDGRRLRLPYTRAGKRALIHPDDLSAFLKRLTDADAERFEREDDIVCVAESPQGSRAADDVEAEAERAGL